MLSTAAGRAIGNALIYGGVPITLALILRRRLDLPRLTWLASACMLSLPEEPAEALAAATLAEIDAWRLTPHEIEAERQRAAWIRHVGDPARRMRRARK